MVRETGRGKTMKKQEVWRRVIRLAPFALLLFFWGVSVVNLGRYPLVEEDEPWILSPGYKLFTRATAADVFLSEPRLAGVPEDCYYRHACEAAHRYRTNVKKPPM